MKMHASYFLVRLAILIRAEAVCYADSEEHPFRWRDPKLRENQ